jgi:hypothetical protein
MAKSSKTKAFDPADTADARKAAYAAQEETADGSPPALTTKAALLSSTASPAVKPEPKSESLDPSKEELDDFAPENLRAEQEYGDEDMGLSNSMTTIPVGRPNKKVFFRCNPDPATHINVRLIKNDIEGQDGKFYYVPRRLEDHPALVDHWRWFTLFPIITRQSRFGLWAVGCRDEDGNMNEAHSSARKVLGIARYKWTRCWFEGANQCKEMDPVRAENIPEPVWPDRTPADIVRLAFTDRVVTGPDHLIIKLLDGRA